MMQVIEHSHELQVKIPYDRFRNANAVEIKKIPCSKWCYVKNAFVVGVGYRNHLIDLKNKAKPFNPIEWIDVSKQSEDQIKPIAPLPELIYEYPLKQGALRDYQRKGVARGLELKRFINADEPRMGKAQPLYSKVSTPSGWVNIGDLKIGNEIFSQDGSIQKVTGIFPQGLQKTYRVIFNDGSYTDCNLDHIWSVRDQNRRRRNKGWVNKTVCELISQGLTWKTNEKRILYGASPILKWEVPMCKPVKYSKKNFVIHPYILGMLLGDGCMTGTSICISIPDHQIETTKRIESLLPENLHLRVNRSPACPQYYISQIENKRKQNQFKKEIVKLGINVKSKQKFIPDEYLKGSVLQRKELLFGLMDSDGSAVVNRTNFHSMSLKLCEGIIELVQSLGGTAKLKTYNRKEKGIEYQVNINLVFPPFTLKEKIEKCISKSTVVTRYISEVVQIEDQYQVCISVSNDDKLYLTDNFIVTHNTIQTITTLCIAHEIKKEPTFPCLIICPAPLKLNWQDEWKIWSTKRVLVLDDTTKDRWHHFITMDMYDVVICNFQSLKKNFVQYYPPANKMKSSNDIVMKSNIQLFNSVVIDESHRLKDPNSQQTKIALQISLKKLWVILLSGTPVKNKPIDLFTQLAIMGRLKEFGGPKVFKGRYCEGGSGASNLKELNSKLNEICFFRRERKEVIKDLPPKQRQTISCDITTRDRYNQAKKDFLKFLEENGNTEEQISDKLKGQALVKMQELKRISAMGKIKEVVNFIDETIENGEKIVIFCVLHSIVDELYKQYPNALMITGRQDEHQKEEAKTKFQQCKKCKTKLEHHQDKDHDYVPSDYSLLICNIEAAGVGHNFSAASVTGFVEYPWTAADAFQCEDRVFDFKKKEPITATYFLGKNTIDEQNFELIQSKAELSNAITGSTDVMKTEFINKFVASLK